MPMESSSCTECWVGLVFSSPALGMIGHQREMDVDRVLARQFVAKLADRFEERQALDVADRAADLAQHEIEAVVALADEILDRIGDVRNDLDGGAEIVAAPLLGENFLIDAAGCDVVLARRRPAGEALVMAEVEVGLGAVVGDEHLAVLIGRHGARVDVEIGIELAQPHLVAARLQQRAKRRRGKTLTEGGHHAAGDEDVPRHGIQPLSPRPRFAEDGVNRAAMRSRNNVKLIILCSHLARLAFMCILSWPFSICITPQSAQLHKAKGPVTRPLLTHCDRGTCGPAGVCVPAGG